MVFRVTITLLACFVFPLPLFKLPFRGFRPFPPGTFVFALSAPSKGKTVVKSKQLSQQRGKYECRADRFSEDDQTIHGSTRSNRIRDWRKTQVSSSQSGRMMR